ncbi:hypothetical protein D3C85_1484080 [compost metagenome]
MADFVKDDIPDCRSQPTTFRLRRGWVLCRHPGLVSLGQRADQLVADNYGVPAREVKGIYLPTAKLRGEAKVWRNMRGSARQR